jgi:RNA polymerase sigma-70 factor (ECF subfamily)
MAETAIWREAERRRLVRLCATISGDRDAAEDLAQETLLEAWRNEHKLVDRTGSHHWLAAVARNVCLRWAHRGERREIPVPELPEQGVELDLGRRDLAELLDGALELLPAASRDVLLRRYVLERTTQEIAADLGISDDAVSMRLTRGKLALRRALDADEWRQTAIWCVGCGGGKLLTRRERGGKAIAFRCRSCDPGGRTAVFPLDNPLFARLVGGLERPSAMFGRVGDWALSYWVGGDGSTVACTRCSADVVVRMHVRGDANRTRGLYVRCDACGEELWSSLVGVAMAAPEVRALRRREPRVHAVVTTGADAFVVAFDALRIAFDRRTYRLLGAA